MTTFDEWLAIVDRILMANSHSPIDGDEVDSMRQVFYEGTPPGEAAEDLMQDGP